MNTAATLAVALSLTFIMLGGGPLLEMLDETADAELQAIVVIDAQQQAQQTADYRRWARRICGNDNAISLQMEDGDIACFDAKGQRVGAVVVARGTP